MPFVIVESPYRSLIRPFVTWLDVTDPDPDTLTVVIVPEYVASHWWERLLYNQTSRRLREALLGRPDTVVTAVPYRQGARASPCELARPDRRHWPWRRRISGAPGGRAPGGCPGWGSAIGPRIAARDRRLEPSVV